MSEKKQKKKTVIDLNDAKKKGVEKKSIGVMEVELFDNGSVQVRNFPDSPAVAIQLGGAAMIELAMYFIGKAAVEAQSRIVKPDHGSIDLVNRSKGNKDGLII